MYCIQNLRNLFFIGIHSFKLKVESYFYVFHSKLESNKRESLLNRVGKRERERERERVQCGL
jgi:hypothetical protein